MTGVATIHSDMRAAFREQLLAIPGIPTEVAWEGRPYDPKVGTPFIRESFRALASSVRALGRGGTIAHRMTGNLSIFFPAGRGTLGVETAAGLLLKGFAPGTALVYGGASGVVMQAERAPLVQETDWISCPVTITIVAYTAN